MTRIHAAVLAVLLLASPALADAQRLEEPPVPRELVDALLGSTNSPMNIPGLTTPSKPILTTGKLPPGIGERVYVPPGARILGGISTGSGSMSYYMTTWSRDSMLRAIIREMPKLGWKERPRQEEARPPWGFMDPPASQDTTARGQAWCASGSGLMIVVDPGIGERKVTLIAGGVADFICQQRENMGPAARATWSRYPTLFNPPDTGREMCASYSSSGGGTQGALTTPMGIGELLDHYSRQLVDSGWKQLELPTVARRFTKVDSTGTIDKIVEVTVSTPSYSPECRELNLRYWERRKR